MPGIDEYSVMKLLLTPESTNCHTVYAREHWIRTVDVEKPKGKTLFLLNIPPYVTENSLRVFYSKIGNVKSVMFAEKPGREESSKWSQVDSFSTHRTHFKFKVGYVVFQSEEDLQKALKLTSINLFNASGKQLIPCGLKKWQNEYEKNYIPENTLQEKVDEYMSKYDQQEREAHNLAKTTAADHGGWVTVGKQGRNSGFEQKESVITKIEEKIAVNKKTKELKNFYTFQIRESKMQHIVSLRKKFDEDKKKVEVLKQGRRFKPF